jgi:DNA-binding Lrp family transcriptional regulator
LYLLTQRTGDKEGGALLGSPREWGAPTEHGRDHETMRLAVAELLTAGVIDRYRADVNGGRLLRPSEIEAEDAAGVAPRWRYLWSEASWSSLIRGVAQQLGRQRLGDLAYCTFSAGVIRGGPWQAWTDCQRLVYAALRYVAAAEFEKQKKSGEPAAWRPRTLAHLAEMVGVCRDTVAAAVAVLEQSGVLGVVRRAFCASSYQAPLRLAVRLARVGELDLSLGVPRQLARFGEFATLRARLVLSWCARLGHAPPARLAAYAAL